MNASELIKYLESVPEDTQIFISHDTIPDLHGNREEMEPVVKVELKNGNVVINAE